MENYDCEFKIWRTRKASKIFTVSLWKASAGYVFNLSNSLLWWANNFPKLFPDWNIRIYYDKSIYSSLQGIDLTEWRELIDRLKKYNHIELWGYNCIWGKEAFHKPHRGTFGSLVRFHAFDDPEIEVAVCHNLEYLTSPKDKERTLAWLDSGKKYHWYCFWNESGQYGVMIRDKIPDKLGLAATFAIHKERGTSEKIFFDSINLVKKLGLEKFPYGVDEVVLTSLVKPKMTRENTFISDMMYNINQLNVLFPKNISTSIVLEFMEEKEYQKYIESVEDIQDEIDFSNIYGFLSEEPTLGAEFIKFVKNDLRRRGASFNPEIVERFHNFLFNNLFREPKSIEGFFGKISKQYDKKDILLSILTTSIINCIDFPGFCVKDKYFGLFEREVGKTQNKAIKTVYNLT